MIGFVDMKRVGGGAKVGIHELDWFARLGEENGVNFAGVIVVGSKV
jgi:hypothetical protein